MKIKTAAKSLICDPSGRVLLLVRSSEDSHAPGRYDFPGGEVDPGEDLAAAASRELLEEVGMQISPSELVLAYAHTDLSSQNDASLNRVFFIGKATQTEVVLSFEHSDFMWVTLDEAIEMYDHHFYNPAMRHIKANNLLSNLAV